MRLKLKNTPEQIELVKAMGSKDVSVSIKFKYFNEMFFQEKLSIAFLLYFTCLLNTSLSPNQIDFINSLNCITSRGSNKLTLRFFECSMFGGVLDAIIGVPDAADSRIGKLLDS